MSSQSLQVNFLKREIVKMSFIKFGKNAGPLLKIKHIFSEPECTGSTKLQ